MPAGGLGKWAQGEGDSQKEVSDMGAKLGISWEPSTLFSQGLHLPLPKLEK